MAKNMRTCNLQSMVPTQSGQNARKNTFNSGMAKDSLTGKNSLTEYKTSGKKNSGGAKGGKNTGT